ncbi:hypothetical protein [Sphingomonas hengshuiensis]|uniref:Uncharacterized protein n=1 Tax=Sphingomonas hengshuiensis TaxID=1609977 RepID=A0A7U4J957_9SPHN|nr:hypothetical protein [Sphingomonas hengshuiensis]AJP72540.1 hypothetical protein TS85_13295 [Sphingomonas hengshuiensis]
MPTFAFALDGKADLMSLNPLEMTNFEMMGAIFGIGGVLLALLLRHHAAKRQLPHVFTATETEEDSIL